MANMYMIAYSPNYPDSDFHVHAWGCRDNKREAAIATSTWPYSGPIDSDYALGLECMGDVATDLFKKDTDDFNELVTEYGRDLVRIMPCAQK